MTTEPTPHEYHLRVSDSAQDAASLLAEESGLSKQQLKQAMQKGAVWLTRAGKTQRIRRAKKTLKADDQLHLYYDEKVLAESPSPAQLIADEQAYSVWYKPYGMRSQGSKWGDHCTINRWAEQHLEPQRTAFIVHRLDRAASGLILLAHQKRSARALSQLFEQRAIEKRYRVVVHGRLLPENQTVTINTPIGERPACSHLTSVDYAPDKERSLLEVRIETGRKHQIRRHLAEYGLPVVGDRLYGCEGDTEDLQLTSVYLAFTCPLTDTPRVYSLPEALQPKL